MSTVEEGSLIQTNPSCLLPQQKTPMAAVASIPVEIIERILLLMSPTDACRWSHASLDWARAIGRNTLGGVSGCHFAVRHYNSFLNTCSAPISTTGTTPTPQRNLLPYPSATAAMSSRQSTSRQTTDPYRWDWIDLNLPYWIAFIAGEGAKAATFKSLFQTSVIRDSFKWLDICTSFKDKLSKVLVNACIQSYSINGLDLGRHRTHDVNLSSMLGLLGDIDLAETVHGILVSQNFPGLDWGDVCIHAWYGQHRDLALRATEYDPAAITARNCVVVRDLIMKNTIERLEELAHFPGILSTPKVLLDFVETNGFQNLDAMQIFLQMLRFCLEPTYLDQALDFAIKAVVEKRNNLGIPPTPFSPIAAKIEEFDDFLSDIVTEYYPSLQVHKSLLNALDGDLTNDSAKKILGLLSNMNITYIDGKVLDAVVKMKDPDITAVWFARQDVISFFNSKDSLSCMTRLLKLACMIDSNKIVGILRSFRPIFSQIPATIINEAATSAAESGSAEIMATLCSKAAVDRVNVLLHCMIHGHSNAALAVLENTRQGSLVFADPKTNQRIADALGLMGDKEILTRLETHAFFDSEPQELYIRVLTQASFQGHFVLVEHIFQKTIFEDHARLRSIFEQTCRMKGSGQDKVIAAFLRQVHYHEILVIGSDVLVLVCEDSNLAIVQALLSSSVGPRLLKDRLEDIVVTTCQKAEMDVAQFVFEILSHWQTQFSLLSKAEVIRAFEEGDRVARFLGRHGVLHLLALLKPDPMEE